MQCTPYKGGEGLAASSMRCTTRFPHALSTSYSPLGATGTMIARHGGVCQLGWCEDSRIRLDEALC